MHKGYYILNHYIYEEIKNIKLIVFRKTVGLMISKMFVDKEGI